MVQWEWLFIFYAFIYVFIHKVCIYIYLFTKYVHIGFVFSGCNKKKHIFNRAGDEKGKLDKTEIFSYKSVTPLPT